MSAYNPPLAETDDQSGPPKYDNGAKQALTLAAWLGLLGGVLMMIVAITVGVDADGDAEKAQFAASTQQIAGFMLVAGAIALCALLAARSVTYDLMYRFGPRPDYRPASTVDAAEHFTPETHR